MPSFVIPSFIVLLETVGFSSFLFLSTGPKKYMNMKHLEAALEDASIAG